MKFLINVFILSFFVLAGYSQTSLDEIIGDMTLPHEGLPHGVPVSYNWQAKPRRGAPEPGQGWTAAIAWGQVYEWANGSPATNVRIQIKDLAMYYLSKKDNKWHLLQSSVRVSGANYVEDFAGDVNKSADIRFESDGSISTTCGKGYNFHFWPGSGRVKIPVNDVAGCYVTVKARIIMNDKNGTDDRKEAKYLMSVGGDWWESLTAPWDNWKTNWDIGIGRFRFITPEWKSFNMYSVPDDTIRKNPPPFVAVTTSAIQFEKNENLKINNITNDGGYLNISIFIPDREKIILSVYDITGRKTEELANQSLNAGDHSFYWDSSAQKPGIYFVKLAASNKTVVKKIQILN